ncbi:MAG: hypothetical protein FIA95_04700, partial [Gemmatimonadetes bacterium]|nr:hypothetical protein [Gemmatimonadota bacterium]
IMDRASRFHALVAPLRAEVVAGASSVALLACDALEQGADLLAAASAGELRAGLADLGARILDAQPAMAPLVALVSRVLEAVGADDDLPSGRAAAHAAVGAFRAGLQGRGGALAARTAALLPGPGPILTLSSSTAVRGALLEAAERRSLEVVVLEGRPLLEGRGLARDLAARGIPVTLAVDAAAAALVPRCAAVLLGADSVGDRGVANKLGSAAAAHAAHRSGVPVLVTADSTKLLPPSFPQELADDRPGEEVMPAAEGVRVWNRYFELVSLDDVTWVVTDAGAFRPDELTLHRAGIRLSREVWAWAARRRPGRPDTSPPW